MEKRDSFNAASSPEWDVLKAVEKAEHDFGVGSKEAKEVLKSEFKKVAESTNTPEEAKNIDEIVLHLSPEKHDKQMEALVLVLQQKGLKSALKVLYRLNSFHLEDDFHRFLVQYLKSGYKVKGISEKSVLKKALSKTLYEVSLPQKEGENKPLKEVLSSMEQLYAGLLSVSNPKEKGGEAVSFEIALSNPGEELSFYVAVPDKSSDLFEKQLLSIFPTAKLSEVYDDYNIFNGDGVSVASVVKFKKSEALPIKTYDLFDYDPLNVIINAFSRMKKEGEGGALQIIFSPKEDFYLKRYTKASERIKGGANVKEALDFDSGFLKSFGKVIKEIFSSGSKKDGEKKEKGDEAETLDAIKRKVSSYIVSTNIRFVVSAESKARAESLLSEVKSSFNQFEDTSGNAFKFENLKGRKLKKVLRNFSYRQFNLSENLPMNLREITSLFHFAESTLKSSSNLKQSKANTASAPVGLSEEGILLGINRHRNEERNIFYAPNDRLRHFYVIGQTGTGKTTILKNMIIQDIKNGDGVCMIDPHGSDIEEVLANIPKERAEDLIYFDPANLNRSIGLNMLEYDENHPEQKTFVVNEMLSIFNKLFNMEVAGGPAFEQYFRNSALLAMEDPSTGSTLLEIARVLSDPAFRAMKLSKCKNPIIKQFWTNAEKTTGEQALANFVPYVTNKFDNFLNNEYMRPIISQQESSLNFRKIMDEKKILLVNLAKGRLGDLNSNLLGLIIVGKILMAALSRVDSLDKDLPPFYLYIDEFQNVTTPSINTILSEARKYKLSLNIAHQFIAQLDEKIRDSVFGNVGSIAVFRVGAQDAEFLEPQFKPVFDANDLLNVDNYNAFMRLLSGGRPARPFSLVTPNSPKGDRTIIPMLKELSSLKYGKPRAEVEKIIASKYGV